MVNNGLYFCFNVIVIFFFGIIKEEMGMVIINMVNNVLVFYLKGMSCIIVMYYKSRNDWIINNDNNMFLYYNY